MRGGDLLLTWCSDLFDTIVESSSDFVSFFFNTNATLGFSPSEFVLGAGASIIIAVLIKDFVKSFL